MFSEEAGMLILLGGEKGGTGKTTLATNLAVQRVQHGHTVVLLDTDSQGAASSWARVRQEAGLTPAVACLQQFGPGLQADLQALTTQAADILMDAVGRDAVELRSGLVMATKAYFPVQASQFDIWTLDHLDELVALAQDFNPALRAFVVLTRVSPNPLVAEVAEAKALLADYPHLHLADTVIYDRIAYRRAAREGKAVHELVPPDRKARAECAFFYEEVFDAP